MNAKSEPVTRDEGPKSPPKLVAKNSPQKTAKHTTKKVTPRLRAKPNQGKKRSIAPPYPGPTPEAMPQSPVSALELVKRGERTLSELLDEQLAIAANQQERVVVMFGADWCSPCKTIKEFIATNPTVQEATKGGRFLYIDVDMWRGPAQRLFAGVDATKLPTLVRVSDSGEILSTCRGSELGLLSPDSAAKNLGRFLNAQAPEAPDYAGDDAKRAALFRAQAAQAKRRAATIPTVAASVKPSSKGSRPGELSVELIIRNQVARRAWFVLPISPPGPRLGDAIPLRAQHWVRFEEHIRAGYWQLEVDEGVLALIPVAAYGEVTLKGWPITPKAGSTELEVWELGHVTLNGDKLRFDKKVPYALHIKDAGRTTHQAPRQLDDAATLKTSLRHTYVIPLQGLTTPDGD